jgi:hypothetical protein
MLLQLLLLLLLLHHLFLLEQNRTEEPPAMTRQITGFVGRDHCRAREKKVCRDKKRDSMTVRNHE